MFFILGRMKHLLEQLHPQQEGELSDDLFLATVSFWQRSLSGIDLFLVFTHVAWAAHARRPVILQANAMASLVR